ncbi:nuclear transport factor 2 family protein [Mycobacterium sp. CVI_P3]|uniref:Nuclear transport factor 2 family protein n=1 Tax=Mycobacterium pinniadriaticum TaxID=2994102 RepID=A0ABT3SCN2_9MYCO|nr:limonene-1,2-epoxide hydrolase family protein [Mycobacterium pinniadriaticum]MCX2930854.1 nuclear transport factor 2 family protein [Mycobacterium pinniadriaticum]MCX2937278.1 nuclear transport factor 2 family protein [Mycobacterium pinniadriaticum]
MSNEAVVQAFLKGMEKPISQIPEHLRSSMTEDCVWGNSGFPPAVGLEDIAAKHEMSSVVFGEYVLHAEILHIAEGADGVVFTERMDYGRTLAGEEILTVPVVGVFEVRDGKIARWTDYFDPRGLLDALSVLPDVEAFFTGKK